MSRTLVLVTGAGRSGTSTAAGTLSLLGVNVPGPFLEANESNPKGFYESRWSVNFHNRLLKRAFVTLADSRPDAHDEVRAAVRPRDREQIATWLRDRTAGHDLSTLKDPRTIWTLDLWSEIGDELDVSMRFLTMLRHPAEVVGSRATHYKKGLDALGERGFAVKNLAGWINAMLLTELQTRERPRAFVRYDDLLADWRTAMATAATTMGVGIDLGPAEDNPVDSFIDPTLSRHRLTWDDVDVPQPLKDVAEEVWRACDRIAESGGRDTEAEAAVDRARERYAEMYRDAQELTRDATSARVAKARAEAERNARNAFAPPQTGWPTRLRRRARTTLSRLRQRG
jgi:hypothetical protein